VKLSCMNLMDYVRLINYLTEITRKEKIYMQ